MPSRIASMRMAARSSFRCAAERLVWACGEGYWRTAPLNQNN